MEQKKSGSRGGCHSFFCLERLSQGCAVVHVASDGAGDGAEDWDDSRGSAGGSTGPVHDAVDGG